MGHVKQETTNQGRGAHEWDYITFSEPRIVLELIRNRIRLDTAYGMKRYDIGQLNVGAPHIMCDNLILTYVALDELIAKTKLSKSQKMTIERLMDGWSAKDIEDEYKIPYRGVNVHLTRAVKKICEQNRAEWEKFAEKTKGQLV